MPFIASVDLGTVGDDITSVNLYACTDSECTDCVELIGFSDVLVSDFPMNVNGIPEGTINIKAESVGRCEVLQCISIIGIPTNTPTPTPTSTVPPNTPTPTSTVPPDTATPTPTSTVPPDTATPTPTPTPTSTPTPTPTSTPTIGPTDVPLQSYVVVGPYDTIQNACIAGNTTGGVLGTYTVTNNNVAVGETVYNTPFFETPSPVSGAPGWYAIGASFIGIYSAIRLDENGVIQELGGFCFFL